MSAPLLKCHLVDWFSITDCKVCWAILEPNMAYSYCSFMLKEIKLNLYMKLCVYWNKKISLSRRCDYELSPTVLQCKLDQVCVVLATCLASKHCPQVYFASVLCIYCVSEYQIGIVHVQMANHTGVQHPPHTWRPFLHPANIIFLKVAIQVKYSETCDKRPP